MTKTSFESALSWVVFSEDDQRIAAEFLKSYEEMETVDELGFGPVRDYYADLFYPATTTVMTRVRYYTLLLSLFLSIEKRRIKGRDFEKAVIRKQNELREILAVNEPESGAGVIGKEAKEKLLRFPSSIYWNGMKTLRIFRLGNWSLSTYYRNIDQYYQRAFGGITDDDGNLQGQGDFHGHWELEDELHTVVESMFPGELEWNSRLNFQLTPQEAQYLQHRYVRTFPDSLMSWSLQRKSGAQKMYPWDLGGAEKHRGVLADAKMFSVLAKGAVLMYYLLLVRAKKQDDGQLQQSLADWFAHPVTEELRAWVVRDWTERAQEAGIPFHRGDKEFFLHWHEIVLNAKSGADLWSDPLAKSEIEKRETAKKPRRERLKKQSYLERWRTPDASIGYFSNPENLPFHLEYRSSIGQRFVEDIVNSL